MKKFIFLTFLALGFLINPQEAKSSVIKTAVLQPNSSEGKDVTIANWKPDENYAGVNVIKAEDWTFDGSCVVSRAMIDFDFSQIPQGAKITKATLSLYSHAEHLHSARSGSNASWLETIIEPWEEATATWNNQPATSAEDRVSLRMSNHDREDYLDIDMTTLVQTRVDNLNSTFGFMFKLQNEQHYRSMEFEASECEDPNRRPKLVIEYEMKTHPVIVLQPNSSKGKDVTIGDWRPEENYAGVNVIKAEGWTFYGDYVISRAMIDFDFSQIPQGAKITKATLSLYSHAEHLHSIRSGSNASWLETIIEPWEEATATWNNQPATSSEDRVSLRMSNHEREDYLDIDMTTLVQTRIDNLENTFGFMFKLQNEQHYRSMEFEASECEDPNRRPKLVIEYEMKAPPVIVLQPNASKGKDVTIGDWRPEENYAGVNVIKAEGWTFYGDYVISRAMIDFDFSQIPQGAKITKATLSLYSHAEHLHSTRSGSNASWLETIIEPWEEATATWNNQPATSSEDRVSLRMSNHEREDYLDIDMTTLVQTRIDNLENTFGFMFKLQNEDYYRSMEFEASECEDPNRRPKLVIEYEMPNNIYKNIQTESKIPSAPQNTLSLSSQNSATHQISAYPNPANDIVTIDLSEFPSLDRYVIKLVDLQSRELYKRNVEQKLTPIDLSHISVSGMIFALIYDANNQLVGTKKIMINK